MDIWKDTLRVLKRIKFVDGQVNQLQEEMLTAHNQYRSLHFVPPLQLDEEVLMMISIIYHISFVSTLELFPNVALPSTRYIFFFVILWKF